MKKKVCLFNGADLVRTGLKSVIDSQRDLVVVEDVGGAKPKKLALLSKKHQPDISVLVVPPAGSRGLMTSITHIRTGCAETKIVLVSSPEDYGTVQVALKSGAAGCIPVFASVKSVVAILNKVSRGQRVELDADLKELKKSKGRRLPPSKGGVSAGLLTAREREIVHHLTSGYNAKQTAQSMKISPKTVDVHRLNIMKKLNMNSLAALTKLAIRSGLTTLDG